MPKVECDYCGGKNYYWSWEEAFDKFGFGDGDGQVETWTVEDVLTEAGYEVTVNGWGLHNTVIVSIKKETQELIPMDDPSVQFGYDNPREYLPDNIVQLLDKELPSEGAEYFG